MSTTTLSTERELDSSTVIEYNGCMDEHEEIQETEEEQPTYSIDDAVSLLQTIEQFADKMYRVQKGEGRPEDSFQLHFEGLEELIDRHCYNYGSTAMHLADLKAQMVRIKNKKEALSGKTFRMEADRIANLKPRPPGYSKMGVEYIKGKVFEDKKFRELCREESKLTYQITVAEALLRIHDQRGHLLQGMQKTKNQAL